MRINIHHRGCLSQSFYVLKSPVAIAIGFLGIEKSGCYWILDLSVNISLNGKNVKPIYRVSHDLLVGSHDLLVR